MASHVSAGLQQFLAVTLLVVLPAWDHVHTRRLRKNAALKLPYYKRWIAALWVLAALAVWATGPRVFAVHRSAAAIPWLLGSVTTKAVAGALLVLFFAAALLPGVRGARSSRTRQAYVREYRRALDFFLPATEEELRWFTFLCISAGICEEILFRGFLMPYLHHGPPLLGWSLGWSLDWSLGWTLALVVASVGFGLNHLYQGPSGVFSTALAGFAFGTVFLFTGNVVLPILLHIAVDLQVVLVLRPAPQETSPRRKNRRQRIL